MSSSGPSPHNPTHQNRANYARRDLQSAFNWLISQPESVRKQATDPDRLMALYYRSEQLFAGSSQSQDALASENPNPMSQAASPQLSGQSFISDLKRMNESFGRAHSEETLELEVHPSRGGQVEPSQLANQGIHSAQGLNATQRIPSQATIASATHVQMSSQTLTEFTTRTESNSGVLTERTLALAKQVKDMFNLSSEFEAINFLVALGFEHAKRILKTEEKK